MPTAEMLAGLERCFPSISTEETRYYLNGVYWTLPTDRTFSMIATDGHRLAKQDMKIPRGAETMPSMIIPRKTVFELMRELKRCESDTVKVMVLETGGVRHLSIAIGPDILYETKLIDGSFPDYQRVIPTGNDKEVTLDRVSAIETIKAVTLISSERGRAVKLSMNGKVTFTCTNPDRGSASQAIEGRLVSKVDDADRHVKAGDPLAMDIGMNSLYLLGTLEQMLSDEITLTLGDPGSPVLFTGKDDKRALHVQMPMRV